jgi:hypothetical protein
MSTREDLDRPADSRDRLAVSVTRLRQSTEPACPWQLRIDLLDVKPAVWRRLIVPSTIRLPALHRIFQVAMGWTNSHLHEFRIGGVRFAEPDPEGLDENPQVDERRVQLFEALGGREFRTFEYLYDFGDGWHHAVVMEDIYAPPAARIHVRCLAGENACPPEDVGGPPGYERYRAAIADPKHEAHAELLAWRGGGFDPARFDLDAVNEALARTGARIREAPVAKARSRT